MPSPLVHSSLLAATPWPWLNEGRTSRPRWRVIAGVALMLLALGGPDLDFALRLLPEGPWQAHGAYMHSIGAALVFGMLFSLPARWLADWRRPWWALGSIGATCYLSHVLLDTGTNGRGVMLFWPISDARWQTPLPLFFGVHHSHLWRWDWHLLTILTEMPIAALIIWAGLRWRTRRVRSSNVSRTSE